VTREAIYGFIAAEKTTYPVRLLCRVLQVSASAFYDWINRGSPVISDDDLDDLDDAHAANELHNAWVEHRRTYGTRRLTAEIRDRGQGWNRKKVARLMTVAGIEGIHRRRHGKKRSRLGAGSVAPDLVKRQFVADGPNQLWVADISYLRTWEGFLYLAVVIDACTRRVVGWAMADHLRRELVLDALGMALHRRKPAAGLIHHSDHGVQPRLNRSSQHLECEVVRGGTRTRLGCGGDGATGDAIAGTPAGRQSGASSAFLGRYRRWLEKYGCGSGSRRVAGRWEPVVPRMWRRDTSMDLPRWVGPASVVCRAGADRAVARREGRHP
jgi:putative transposase